MINRTTPVRTKDTVGALAALCALLSVTGCQNFSGAGPVSQTSGQLMGQLMGGEQPVVGATIQLYAAGSGGDGTGASLVGTATTSDQYGNFNITNNYTCPTQTTEVYLVATGGNPGQSSSNPNIALMAALGQCGSVRTSYPFLIVDEVTTVASIAALYPYMSTTNTPSTANSYASLASGTSDAANLNAAFSAATEYANVSTGTAPGPSLPSGYYASSNEVDSLANVLAYCVDSTGGLSGTNTACGNLFRLATPTSGIAPIDTVGAVIDILNNPTHNVGSLYNLIASQSPFQPADSVAPSSWALPILQIPAAPTFSLTAGTYSSSQILTITDSVSGTAIYYTTDGSTPTKASNLYSSPITISSTETVKAIAVNGGTAYGPTTSATYTLPMDFTLTASPQTVYLGASGTGSGTVPVNLEVTPINGFSSPVTVTINTTLTTGVTANASSYTVTPGIITQIQLTATSSVYTTQTVTITGVSGSLLHNTTFELSGGSKPDYYLTTSAAAVSLVPGSSQTFQLEANPLNGFSSTVTAQVTGLPAGVTASQTTFTLTPGAAQSVTLTAGSGVSTGNTLVTFTSTATGSLSHSTPVMLNYGTQTQDFVLGTPVSLNVSSGGNTTMTIMASAIGGFSGNVTATISGLPTGSTGVSPSSSSVTLNVVPAVITSNLETPTNIATVTLTGGSSLTNRTVSFTVTATATVGTTTLTHQNTVMLTLAPTGAVGANICTSGNAASSCQGVTLSGNAATAFPSYYVGFSMPSATLEELTGVTATSPTISSSFVSLLSNLDPYVGEPSIRSQLPGNSTDKNMLINLKTAAAYTNNNVTSYPQYFLTTSEQYTPSTDLPYVQSLNSSLGSANILGFELANEPDEDVPQGYRPMGWTYSDYLAETAGYQSEFALTTPQLIGTAAAFDYWDVGIPALTTQMLVNGQQQLSLFTAHRYALTACSNTPTVAQLLADSAAHNYYTRFAGLVQTLGSIPVRAGEMNSVSCTGYSGVSNVLAASLWLIDTAFELKLAGTAGFNVHSNGTTSGAANYDIGYNSGGSLSVYSPFYGALFFAQAIQNGAKLLPVTITQSSGNVKVWATIDAINTVRVVVIEKDTDAASNTKSVTLNLGTSYTKTGTVTQLWAGYTGSASSPNGFSIAGQSINANGVLTPSTTTTAPVTGSGGIYTITVNDGTASILTVPM